MRAIRQLLIKALRIRGERKRSFNWGIQRSLVRQLSHSDRKHLHCELWRREGQGAGTSGSRDSLADSRGRAGLSAVGVGRKALVGGKQAVKASGARALSVGDRSQELLRRSTDVSKAVLQKSTSSHQKGRDGGGRHTERPGGKHVMTQEHGVSS